MKSNKCKILLFFNITLALLLTPMLPRPATCLPFSPTDYAQTAATLASSKDSKDSKTNQNHHQQQQPIPIPNEQRTPLQHKK